MEKQQITGYRNLTQAEVNKINEIKALADQVGKLVLSMDGPCQGIGDEGMYVPDQRWLNIARTQLQQGFMALTRSVAQPESF